MKTRSADSIRLTLGIIVPTGLVLLGAVVAVLVSLNQMASAVNRTESDLTRRSAEAALASTARDMADTVRDYAQWDDAVRHLYGTPDETFVLENLANSTVDPVFFDTVYVIDSNGSDVFGYRLGEPLSIPTSAAFDGVVARMIADLPADGRTFDARSGIARGALGLAFVAVGPVVPASEEVMPGSDRARFLVLSRSFDANAVREIGTDYLIRDLSLSDAPTGADNRVVLFDYDGNPVGSLNWRPRQLGSTAQEGVGPLALAMLGLLAATVMLLTVATVRGLLKLQKKEMDASHAAAHDSLTGLPNRTALVERLREAIEAYGRGGLPVAVAYLDLDGFKEVNDSYGHAVGDRLLRAVADAFRRVSGDRLLVRLGGDEFAVAVEDADATAVAIDLGTRLVEIFDERIEIDGRPISLSTSVGVVGVDSADIGVEELLRRADVAMYRAKSLGRDRICVFEPALDAARTRRIEIAERLHNALIRNELTLAYQPVFDAGTKQIVAAEALLRWDTQEGEAVSTAEFVAIAEESDLIDDLGAWTLRHACREARSWGDLPVAVNVSPAQFRKPGFVGLVNTILRQEGFDPRLLEMEVTENFFVAHPDEAHTVLNGLRRLGIRLALDDFGTGYSSIGFLRRFAFSKLKIDRALIAGIDKDPQARELIHATVHIGRALGLRVTAEGVETESEAILARAAGCHELQGFFFAKPMSGPAFRAMLRAGELESGGQARAAG